MQCRSLAFALEERVLLDVQHDVQIAGRPAVDAGFALARVENARAFFHARRNFDGDRALARDASLAAALLQGSTISLPEPPQVLQARVMAKKPC